MTITMILAFALLGAFLGLDVVSFPQVMISRPIVASTLAGTLGGSASDGLLAGVFLEMMALETLPVGASRYPEWGTASVVGGALYVSRQGDATSALLFAMLGAMITAWVGGYSMYALRRLNGRWTKRALPALEAGDASVVTWLQMRGLGGDLLRGFVLTALALALLVPLTAIAVANGHGDSATIRAVAEMRHPTARLAIAGSGDHRAALERLAHSLDLGDRVKFLGFISEAEKLSLLRSAWVLAFTSPKEGWGITNLEAAACATPVVASSSPGLRETVVDGETGFLVPHGDLAALTGALRRVVSDPALVESLGAAGRRFASRYTWAQAAEQTEAHLESIVAERVA